MRTKTVIAVLAATAGLAAAMQASLEKRYTDAEFVHIKKLSERPAGSTVASLGIPSFVPGQDGLKVLSFGSRILEGATPQERSHQWTTLRDPSATTEEVLAELGNWSEYTILQNKGIQEAKSAIVDTKLAIAESDTDEERLALYRAGFNMLASMLG